MKMLSPKRNMMIMILIIVFLFLSMSGCKTTEKNNSASNNHGTSTTQSINTKNSTDITTGTDSSASVANGNNTTNRVSANSATNKTTATVAKESGSTVANKVEGGFVEYIGRFKNLDNGEVMCSWSGSKLSAGFTGTAIALNIKSSVSQDFVEVRIDGKYFSKITVTKEKEKYVLAENLSSGTHYVEVFKRTEGGMSNMTFGRIDYMGGKAAKTKTYSRRIEVLGDSITAGYGNEGPNAWRGFKLSEQNACKTYGMLTAEKLSAEATILGWSGMGLAQDLGGKTNLLLPHIFYRTVGTSANADWEFKGQKPDVVVINIGTNDFASNVNPESYVSAYLKFLENHVRKQYPDSLIICAIGPINNKAYSSIKKVVNQINKAGDDKVLAFQFETYIANEECGADGHPSLARHEKMANELTEFIREHTSW